MRTHIRDIIVNALDEARIVNRNQPVPGNIMESAFLLLKKRLARYSNTNYLSFTRKEIDFKPTKEKLIIGEYDIKDDYKDEIILSDTIPMPKFEYMGKKLVLKEAIGTYKKHTILEAWNPIASAYAWRVVEEDPMKYFNVLPDVEVNNVQEIVRCYTKANNTDEWVELNFVAYEDFYNFDTGDYNIYTVVPQSDVSHLLILKDTEGTIKLMYNEYFEITIDDEMNIPGQYISLFTTGLVYDLSLQYPRLSDNITALVKQQLDELEENVRRSSSVNKFIARPVNNRSYTMGDFIAGRFLGV